MLRTAIIGDIKSSRRLENWSQIFQTLQATLDEVNHRFAGQILIPFKPTVGDEFQGALKTRKNAFDVYNFIRARLPVPFYCGIGVGEVEKTASSDGGLRGTAFYNAREALEQCKARKRNLYVIRIEPPLCREEQSSEDEIINTLLALIGVLENSMTRRQREIVAYYRLHPDLTLNQVGEHFGVRQGTVSNILKAAHYHDITAGEHLVKQLLSAPIRKKHMRKK
jgi:hypothetical protein